jgi:hypothetical protein
MNHVACCDSLSQFDIIIIIIIIIIIPLTECVPVITGLTLPDEGKRAVGLIREVLG